MITPSIMYLTPEDVQEVGLPYETVCHLVESVFVEHSNNRFEMPAKTAMHPYDNTFVHIMPGYLPKFESLGCKYIMAWFDNPKKDLPSLGGLIVLNDLATGLPMAIMDTSWISNVRTAAVTAIAIKYLARRNAEVLGIVGTGLQARQHAALLNDVAPNIKTLVVYDINPEVAQEFKKDVEKYTRFNVNLCHSAEEAIKSADIVVTITGMLKPKTYLLDWVQTGTLVLPVHAGGWDPKLLHRADLLIFDDYLQCKSFFGNPGGQYYPLPEDYCQLGEIVSGQKEGRIDDNQVIVNINLGMSLHDIRIAPIILDKAIDMGLGTKLPYNVKATRIPLSD